MEDGLGACDQIQYLPGGLNVLILVVVEDGLGVGSEFLMSLVTGS